MTLERMGSRSTWEKKAVTLGPDIESVSSTAMVMQVQIISIFPKMEDFVLFHSFPNPNNLSKSRFCSPRVTFSEHPTQGALR